jgi:hypothetical protein
MRRYKIMLGLLVFGLPLSPSLVFGAENATNKQFESLFSQATCGSAAKDVLKDWGILGQWHEMASSNSNTHVFQSPTEKIGTWVRVVFQKDHTVQATKLSWTDQTAVNWQTEKCVAMTPVKTVTRTIASMRANIEQEKHSLDRTKYVTDAEIAETVADGKPGMIFAWSPQMPISYAAYPEAKKLAESMGLRFIAVVDPNTNSADAKKNAAAHGIDNDATRANHSVELLARGMDLHYPSLVIFNHGKIAKSFYPGYWDHVEVLKHYVERTLQ